MKDNIIEAAKRIYELYKTDDGGVGGYAHIVFDDFNIEQENILWCIKEAEKGEYDYSEETRQASLKALRACLSLTEEEVWKAIRYAWRLRKKYLYTPSYGIIGKLDELEP